MGFTTIIFAFIFIYFDFNLNNLNVLPDFIGYILFYYGVASIMNRLGSEYFLKAKDASKILIVLAILDTIIKHSTVLNNVINDFHTIQGKLFTFVFVLTVTSLLIYSIYNLCKGIEVEANQINDIHLVEKSKEVFRITFIFETVSCVVLLVSSLLMGQDEVKFSMDGTGAFFVFVVIAFIVLYVFFRMFSLLKAAEKAFNNGLR
ncbi:hypothetical protein [Bacillus sp. EAC]|uniref:hypothetical protein n=1 Tax=Bacillus sp. EAC TaxID=1978338 RepID=UPI000B43BFC9|nr:hypothetical protein [Bacillus sp. EAC]